MKITFTSNMGNFKVGQTFEVKREEKNLYVIEDGGKEYLIPAFFVTSPKNGGKTAEQAFNEQSKPMFNNLEHEGKTPEEIAEMEAKAEAERVKKEQEEMKKAAEAYSKKLDKRKKELDKMYKSGKGIPLSFITDGKLPTSGVDHTLTPYPDGHFHKNDERNIPKIDWNYQWEPNILEALWLAHKLNSRCLLTGPPGTGKTTATKELAAWLRQPYAQVNGKDGIEPSSFLGYPWVSGGSMEWRDGSLPLALKGGYIYNLDEAFKLHAGISMIIQPLTVKGGFLTLDDKPGSIEDKIVKPHEDFRFFFTDNVKGTGEGLDVYSSTQLQDVSSLDRYTMTVVFDYMPEDVEVQMFSDMYPLIAKKTIHKLISLANLVRSGFQQNELFLTLSPRGVDSILSIMSECPQMDIKDVLKLGFINKFSDDNEVQAIHTMMGTVGI